MSTTKRVKRMLNSVPYYYSFSDLFKQLQEAQGNDYDSVEEANRDLRNQLSITNATWGLKFWEDLLDIPINENDSYDIRRSRVLSRWRSVGNFSADLIESICEAFTNGEVKVRIDTENYIVYIIFISETGVPSNVEDLEEQIEEIVHVHYGIEFEFRYLVWEEFDSTDLTWDEFDLHDFTWDELELWNTERKYTPYFDTEGEVDDSKELDDEKLFNDEQGIEVLFAYLFGTDVVKYK